MSQSALISGWERITLMFNTPHSFLLQPFREMLLPQFTPFVLKIYGMPSFSDVAVQHNT